MTISDAGRILAVLRAAYPHTFRDMSEEEAMSTAQLWATLIDEPYEVVSAALYSLISNRTVGYAPTIGEVKERILRLYGSDGLSESEAWTMVAKACENGFYGYAEEYAKLPPAVQRAVGSAIQLREWAMADVVTFSTVIASNFRRAYAAAALREREDSMLPSGVRESIAALKSAPETPALPGESNIM